MKKQSIPEILYLAARHLESPQSPVTTLTNESMESLIYHIRELKLDRDSSYENGYVMAMETAAQLVENSDDTVSMANLANRIRSLAEAR